MTNTKTSKETLTRKKTIVKINVDLDIDAVKLQNAKTNIL